VSMPEGEKILPSYFPVPGGLVPGIHGVASVSLFLLLLLRFW